MSSNQCVSGGVASPRDCPSARFALTAVGKSNILSVKGYFLQHINDRLDIATILESSYLDKNAQISVAASFQQDSDTRLRGQYITDGTLSLSVVKKLNQFLKVTVASSTNVTKAHNPLSHYTVGAKLSINFSE